MSEHPILFSDLMIRAILAGAKTQTRRIGRPQPQSPGKGWDAILYSAHMERWCWAKRDGGALGPCTFIKCPYGTPGDVLWVREAWAESGGRILYRADRPPAWQAIRWKPSIYLPRSACRLLLDVVAVEVERLHAIDDEDARAEGVADRDEFAVGWNKINGRRMPWESNPWVWVVEFALHR